MDQGETKFTDLSTQEQLKSLANYTISDYLKIEPTAATKKVMANYRLLFKPYGLGFRLATSCAAEDVMGAIKYRPLIFLDETLEFNFGLYATDAYFEHYSLVNDITNNQLYFFTNAPSKATIGSANVLVEDGTVDITYLLTVPHSRRLIHQLAIEELQLKSILDPDSVAAIPLTDIDTADTRARLHSLIQSEKRKGLIGYLRLYVKGDDTRHLLEFDESDPTDIKQYALDTTPSATLKFKNRTTFWRYTAVATSTIWTTTSKKPLTKNGFVAIENTDLSPVPAGDLKFPNPGVQFIKKESSDYYSDIYI